MKEFTLQSGGKTQKVFVFTNGDKTQKVLNFLLNKKDSNFDLFVFFVLQNDDFLNLRTVQTHCALNTNGFTFVRGVLYDRSKVHHEGLIRIEPEGKQTNAYLQSNILLIGEEAKADSIPSLEIEACDVKASHGATVGRLDEELLFYMQSRGISQKEAEILAIEGFFEPIITKITSLKQRDFVRKLLLGGRRKNAYYFAN